MAVELSVTVAPEGEFAMGCNVDLTHRALCHANAQRYFIGDDWKVRFRLDDEDGDPIDLTGMSFRATIRDAEGAPLLERDSADSAQIEILDQGDPATIGRIRVLIARTESVAAGMSYYDVVRVDTDASERVVAVGRFEAKARYTPTPLP